MADVVSDGAFAALVAGLLRGPPRAPEGEVKRGSNLWEAWREPWLRWMLVMLVLVADGVCPRDGSALWNRCCIKTRRCTGSWVAWRAALGQEPRAGA